MAKRDIIRLCRIEFRIADQPRRTQRDGAILLVMTMRENERLKAEAQDAEMASGALVAIQSLLDGGGIPRGMYADDQVRNLICLYNRRGDEIERIREKANIDALEAAGLLHGSSSVAGGCGTFFLL